MAIVQLLLPELDRELGLTRRILERVPLEDGMWKPHDKSMSMGRLSSHVAELFLWAQAVLETDEFDITQQAAARPVCATREELLSLFDTSGAKARELLAPKTDAEMLGTWTFKKEGKVLFSMPRVAAFRNFILNHAIHHRGQLSVYLRLKDVPVPSIYGPSADEATL